MMALAPAATWSRRVLQRCGSHACPPRGCSSRGRLEAPESVQHALRSLGRPLDPDTRSIAEHTFERDFSRVRVHDDRAAGSSAVALDAQAYTVGTDIVFAPGRYSPWTTDGQALLRHELSHVVQQGVQTGRSGSEPIMVLDNQTMETEADGGPWGSARPTGHSAGFLQRKLEVDAPTAHPAGAPAGFTNESVINGYLATLCPGTASSSGKVSGACPPPATATALEASGCICDMVGLPVTWAIVIDDTDWPHTDDATKTVHVHSPFSGVTFGSWAKGPPTHRSTQPNWLVLGHELCGHARLLAHGIHPTGPPPAGGGRPSHDPTVQIENKIAAEHGIAAADLRGLFADPHHGESFGRVTIANFPFGSADISALPAADRHQIDVAETFIKSAPVEMDVIGHADPPTATAAGNLAVSQRRADAVKAALVTRGIAAGRFKSTKGVSSTECSAAGRDPACRKVEVFMFIFAAGSVTHP